MIDVDVSKTAARIRVEGNIMAGSAWYFTIGRTVSHIIATPYRVAMLVIEAMMGLASSPSRRTFSLIALHGLWELLNWTEPFIWGLNRCVRSIPLPKIEDSAVYSNQPHPNGECWGSSIWFLGLYHALEKRCKDPEKRLYAVANEFCRGVPKQAVLLQTTGLTGLSYSLLDRIIAFVTSTKKRFCRALIAEAESMLIRHVNLAVRSVRLNPKNVPVGTYLVYHKKGPHETVYIKLSESLGYTFDVEGGLVRHHSTPNFDGWLTRANPRRVWDLRPLSLGRRVAMLLA